MSNPQNNILELKEFHVNPEWRKFVTSMLFESGTEVAYSKWECNGEEFSIPLVVNGSVRIVYEDRVYTDPVLFPFKLRDRIKERPYDWELADNDDEDPVAFIDNNNWFEYLYGNGGDGEVFEEDISKVEAERFLDDMCKIAKHMCPDYTEVVTPAYVLEGYDKDNSVYEIYALGNDLDELKELACEFIPLVDTDMLVRKCSDGHMEPIDTILISEKKTNKKVWELEDTLTFRLYLNIKFNRPVTDDDCISLGSFDFDFNGKSICFDFEEISGSRNEEDPTIVAFETRNPDYVTFPKMGLLTKELLKNVTSINEIHIDIDEVWTGEEDDEEDDKNYLEPIEIVDGAFVVIEDDGSMTEIPIEYAKGCTTCNFYGC